MPFHPSGHCILGAEAIAAECNGRALPAVSCRYAPPHLPETIAVGSTTQNDVVAPFSNVGRCVDVYAPGVAIRGADAKAFRLQPNRTPKTVAYSGTSQSCPIVVGAG